MKYKISKEKVKQALITEPLKAGSFYDREFDKSLKTCPVCAVGSVLRAVAPGKFLSGSKATGYNFLGYEVEEAYGDGQFLGILSCEFEIHSNEYGDYQEISDSDDMRMFLLFLTEAFCPDTLEFEA